MTGCSDRTDTVQTDSTTEVGWEGPPPQAVLELDHVYEALSSSRRRYLCYTLFEDTEWTLTELATKIASWEHDIPEHAVGHRLREPVYVSLYHVHVPKLVNEGIVGFDRHTETITPAEHAEQVLAALQGMGAGLTSG